MRLPAYGRDLVNLQRTGRNVEWLLISLSFALGKALPRLVVPAGVKVSDTDFRCVSGLNCLIAHKGETGRALEVAEAALMAGALMATVHGDGETITTDQVKAIRGIK